MRTIPLDEKALNEKALKDAELVSFDCGLYVILDLRQGTSPSIWLDAAVRVHRPDGSSFETVVNGVEVWGPNVGLFFRGAEEHEIPVLSEIEFVAA
jgi:hypothetical protein